jgi:hypothetical protein
MSVPAPLQLSRHHAALVLLAATVAALGLIPSADGDIWWHLAAGREMVARGGFLSTDPFSVSAADRPWIDVHWLFQLGAYAVHEGFGLTGLVLAKCGLLGAGAVILAAALGRRAAADWSRALFMTLLLAALFSARSLLLLRPVVVSLVFLALFFYVLETVQRRGQTSWLWALPGLQVLWANFQGLSALGPAVVAAYVVAAGAAALRAGKSWPFAPEVARGLPVFRHFKALALALVGCGLACGVTPFGLRAFALPLLLAGRLLPGSENLYAHAVAENVPPYLLERYTGGEFWHLKWFLGVLALATLAAGRRLRLSHALLVLGFTLLALMSNRNVLLLYWMATPIAALYLAPALRRSLRAPRLAGARHVLISLNAAAVLVLLGFTSAAAARETSLAEPTPFRAPSASAAQLERLQPGDVFSAAHQGGYLIWRLYPSFRPYIDSRLVLRSPAEFREYLSLSEEPQRFDAFQARHRFSYVVLPTAYPDRYLALIAHLYRSPSWNLIYTDGSEVLFARADLAASASWDLSSPEVVARILAASDERFGSKRELLAAARVQLARLLATVGELQRAEQAVSGLDHADARRLRARLRFAAGDNRGAESLAKQVLLDDSADVRSLSLLARIALDRGQVTDGIELLKRALSADPFDAEATELLAALQENER